ncbi:hypothetical protein, conserved [Eimeria necatrix]|uniref:C2H2-type domain-containing protein n=1 Tax=Eimeria necatrix TaxID=51315 RepID=U6MKM9_9EIME|nr:hypothetical protein, conserved [Eimeria necatrix]CDJ63014.1 hypothetical protein, conserved [Eimeria necatrix]
MAAMLTAGREEIPIFEALQSASNTLIMPPSHHQVQQQKQSHASQQFQEEQQRQPSVQLPVKAATDGGMDATARNSGTENPTIVVGMLVQCGECGKKFINSHYLDKHINKRHRGDVRQSGIARFDTSHFSTLGQTGFQQPFETVRAIVSAPLSIFEQQQQQQLKQQQQLLQQQQSLQQQQHLLQQQLSMLSAAALRANEVPQPVTAISHPAPVVSATGAVPFGEVGNTLAAAAGTKNSAIPTADDKQQTVAEVKQDVQKEIQKAVKAPQHRDTALMLLNEIRSPTLRNTKVTVVEDE